MAKSFTVLQKDIADSLRFQTLTQPPEVVELSKLSEDIEKILKKPHNYIQTGPILDEYYSKLIRMMSVMKDVNQKSFSSEPGAVVSPPLQPPQQPPTTTSTGNVGSVSTAPTVAQPPPAGPPPPPAATIQPPQATLQPSNTPTAQATPSASSSKTPTSQKTSPHKKNLYAALRQADPSFSLHSDGKQITLENKVFQMADFNSIYTKLQDSSLTKKQHKNFSPAEKKILGLMKKYLEKSYSNDGDAVASLLPGLAPFLSSASPPLRHRAKSTDPPKHRGTPVTTRSRRTRQQQDLLQQTTGGGVAKKKSANGKIHFKRWSRFIA